MIKPRLLFFLFLFLSFLSLSLASAPTFCKCTCFTNSTIIPLGPQSPPAPPNPANPPSKSNPAGGPSFLDKRAATSSCAQCNRAFCMKYNLPICKDAEEKDIVTSCFQRDSRKDQIIVWGFILGTAGLLGWAGVRKALEGYEKGSAGRGRGARQGNNEGGVLGRVVRLIIGRSGGGNGNVQTPGATRRGGQQQQQYTPLG
ncbi:hypothetical protein QBC42DRAFT_202412, partial [Cladorrhinum samala]